MLVTTPPCAAEQPEAAGSPGHRGEQVRIDSHLCSEDEQPAAAGPEQQRPERPAAGHGQVSGGGVEPRAAAARVVTVVCLCRLDKLETLFVHKNQLSYLPLCLANISTLQMVVVSGERLTCIPTRLCSSPSIK